MTHHELFEKFRGLAVNAGDNVFLVYGDALNLGYDSCIEQALMILAKAVKKADPDRPMPVLKRFFEVCVEGDLIVWVKRTANKRGIKYPVNSTRPADYNEISDMLADYGAGEGK